MKKYFFVLTALVVFLTSCTPSANNTADKAALEQNIVDAESNYLKSPETTMNVEKAKIVLETYEKYAANFPEDEKTPEYLFKAGEIYSSVRNTPKALEAYERIYKKFPKYQKTPQTLFLMAFAYENDLKDLNRAKELYQEFLSRYPEHELSKDVRFSLANLGKSPEEIIKGFKEQAAADTTKAAGK